MIPARRLARRALYGIAIAAAIGAAPAAAADQPDPSPSPAPTIAPGTVRTGGTISVAGIGQWYSGPGVVPPEGAAFSQGSPVSPGTPYDFFNSQPIVPGNAFSALATIDLAYGARSFDVRLQLGAQTLAGSATGNAYWNEPPIPTLDPHISYARFALPIAFPAQPGGDTVNAFRASVLSGEIASKDRSMRLRAGWFSPLQTDGFVYAQIPRPDAAPGLAVTLPESLGDGPPVLENWNVAAASLPLQGIDGYVSRGPWTFEASDSALPAPPGTAARMTLASVVYARDALRISADVLHASSGGLPVVSTTLYGYGFQVYPVTQGPLVTTLLDGQRQTIFGLRAQLALGGGVATGEYGRSTYGTTTAANPGSSRPGSWYHAAYEHKTGIVDWTGDLYRFEPTYATMILPYGSAENVWAVAYSWPGPWLKGTYQLVDTSAVGINRQGFRVRASVPGTRFDVRAVVAVYKQIEPIDYAHGSIEGWVEGFYLPQFTGAATLGIQKQTGLRALYHAGFADVTAESIEDTQHRDGAAPGGTDAVSIRFPQWTVGLSRHIGEALLSAGTGRFGLYGNFSAAAINADLAERVWWLGMQVQQSKRLAAQLTVRSYASTGSAISAGGALPQMHGSQVFLEERIDLGTTP